MSEIDPYQSPLTESKTDEDSREVGIWRKGARLVAHRGEPPASGF